MRTHIRFDKSVRVGIAFAQQVESEEVETGHKTTATMAKQKFAVKITRYINPHKFFFKLDRKLSEFEQSISEILATHCEPYRRIASWTGYEPRIGETVIVFMQPWNKYVRAKCDFIAEFVLAEPTYTLWALDDG